MADHERINGILQCIANAAERGEALAPALRASQLPDGQRLADLIDCGEPLTASMRQVYGPLEIDLLSGPRPSLAGGALLLAEQRLAAQQRRRLWFDAAAYPICLILLAIGLLIVLHSLASLPVHWPAALLAVPGATLLALVLVVPLLDEHQQARIPLVGSWVAHRRRALSYDQVALAVAWRLDEAQLVELFGGMPAVWTRLLARRDAEDWCRRMAGWHRRASRWRMLASQALVGACLMSIAGAILIMVVLGFAGQHFANGALPP